MDNDTNRARAIADGVGHIEQFTGNELPDGDLLIVEDALGYAYDRGAEFGMPELHSADDASQALNVSRVWLLRYAKENDLGMVIGNQRIFTDADVQTFRNRRVTMGRPRQETQV